MATIANDLGGGGTAIDYGTNPPPGDNTDFIVSLMAGLSQVPTLVGATMNANQQWINDQRRLDEQRALDAELERKKMTQSFILCVAVVVFIFLLIYLTKKD